MSSGGQPFLQGSLSPWVQFPGSLCLVLGSGVLQPTPLLVPGTSLFRVDSLTLSPPSTELPLLTSWESAVCFLPEPPQHSGSRVSMETPAAAGPPTSHSLALSYRPKLRLSHWPDILLSRCTHSGWTLHGQTGEQHNKCRLETKIFQDMGSIWGKIPKSSPWHMKDWGYLVCVLWSANG